MAKTDIEWSQHVWNPVRGCSRVSPGCDNCYAMWQARRSHGPGGAYEGLTTIRKGKIDWTGHVNFVPELLDVPILRKKPTIYFVNSMSDLFHESLNDSDICALFGVMSVCQQHTFQVLTKRAKRMLAWFESLEALRGRFGGMTPGRFCRAAAREGGLEVPALPPEQDVWPLPNVWLGVSAENQEQADRRIPYLLQCPAEVRWVSMEPLLGAVDLTHLDVDASGHPEYCQINALTGRHTDMGRPCPDVPHLDWVVVGGESGNFARDCNLEWVASVVKQCGDAHVPIFVKQLGAKPYVFEDGGVTRFRLNNKKGGDMAEFPHSLKIRQFPL